MMRPVIWEQCVACGTPMIVKDWEGMHHVDMGGNCQFIKGDDEAEMQDVLISIVEDRDKYAQMFKVANSEKRKEFLYSEIAKKSILI